MLREDGKLIPTTHYDFTQSTVHASREDSAEQAREYVRRHWKYREPKPGSRPGDLLDRAQSHFLCISGMAFQDAWNIDLARLRRCCVHVMTQDNQLVPFCARYMTGAYGQRLE